MPLIEISPGKWILPCTVTAVRAESSMGPGLLPTVVVDRKANEAVVIHYVRLDDAITKAKEIAGMVNGDESPKEAAFVKQDYKDVLIEVREALRCDHFVQIPDALRKLLARISAIENDPANARLP